jgi:hypothetical protein
LDYRLLGMTPLELYYITRPARASYEKCPPKKKKSWVEKLRDGKDLPMCARNVYKFSTDRARETFIFLPENELFDTN